MPYKVFMCNQYVHKYSMVQQGDPVAQLVACLTAKLDN